MRIVVVHDRVPTSARADELDAGIQARQVCNALAELGHEATTIGATLDLGSLAGQLRRIGPDIVFNLTECLGGQGRLIHVVPALLEGLRLPFTGASAEAQFMTSNKLLAKRMLRAQYLPTPPWHELDDIDDVIPGRFIIKSVWEHASLGLDEGSIVTVDDAEGIQSSIATRLDQLGGEGFAEAYIDGREFNLALLAGGPCDGTPQVLPPAEIVFSGYRPGKPRIVGYRAKWDAGSFEYHNTPPHYEFSDDDAPLLERLSSLAIECWRLFRLRGYARVDFRVDEAGRPWILEVNANPCLSHDAGFAAALNQAGIGFAQAIERILDDSHAPALARAETSMPAGHA